MPRVPTLPAGAGVELSPLPGARLQPQPMNEGLQRAGAALEQAGQFGFAYANEQDRIDAKLDEAAVKNADVETTRRIRERLYTGDHAFFTLQGFNAVNAREGVEKDLGDIQTEVSARLTTPRQRETYARLFESRQGAELTGIARHVQQQTLVEERRASLSRIAESSEEAVTHWDDPQRREVAIETAVREVRGRAASDGWAPEATNRAVIETRSNVNSRIVESLIDRGEVEKASAELERHRDEILPDAAANLDRALYGPLLDRKADAAVDLLMGTLPPPETVVAQAENIGAVLPRMTTITAQNESRNRDRGSDGRVVTSPKGAQGRMQVMPGTQTDPGFGIRASNGTLEDTARVGREYLAKMMERYNNDPAKAWAAYNWGPGNLDEALKKHGADWLAHAPAETRAYVVTNLAALGGRGIAPGPQQAPREHDVAELLSRVDEMNLPFDVEQRVRARLQQRVALDEGLLQRKREQAEDDAWASVEKLGDGFTSVDQLPAAVRATLTPRQRLSFEAIAERNVKGHETDWGAYARYSDMYANDPAGFAKLGPAELRAKLGDSEFETVMGWRRSAQQGVGRGRTNRDQVTYSRIDTISTPLLIAAGIVKPENPPGAAVAKPEDVAAYNRRLGQFRKRVSDDVQVWQAAHKGQDIDDNTIAEIADRQLVRMWTPPPPPVSAYDKPVSREFFRFEEEPGARGAQFRIPPQTESRIKQAYRQRWGRDPTPSEIGRIFLYGPRGGR